MNRIAILSNAGSGRNRKRTELLRLLDATSGVDQQVTADSEEIEGALGRLLDREPAVLAVNGGDGTLQAVLTAWHRGVRCGALPESLPPIAVLPAGSTNMSAHDLGCGGRLKRRVGDLLALRDRPPSAWRIEARAPLAVVDAEAQVRLGFFFGMGTIVRGIEYWHETLRHGGGAGEWGAGAALLRAAWGMARKEPPFDQPARVRIGTRPGRSAVPAQRTDVSFLLATTMRRLFLGISPFWGSDTGPLALTWVEDGARRLVPRVPALLRGQGDRLPAREGYHATRSDEIELSFDDPWAIDGEVFAATPRMRLSEGPRLSFLRLVDDLGPAAGAVP